MIADELRRRTNVITDIVELLAKLYRDSLGDPLPQTMVAAIWYPMNSSEKAVNRI